MLNILTILTDSHADEPMRSDESVDPPRGIEVEQEPLASPSAGPSAAAPLVEMPKRGAAAARGGRALGAADLIVALLALAVLGLSLLGLAWVLRSK